MLKTCFCVAEIYKYIKKIIKYIFRIKYYEVSIQCCYSFKDHWIKDDDCYLTETLYDSIIEFLEKYEEFNIENISIRLSEFSHKSDSVYDFHKNRNISYVPDDEFTLKHPYENISISIYKIYRTNEENKLRKFIIIKSYSMKEIKKFINNCYSEYIEKDFKDEKENKNNIYMHKYDDKQELIFTKYPFIPKKSFDSIFFPEKEEIISLVDNFLNGNYNFPKLSFLLYGEPGTGKTSFIEALANYTDRSIIVCKLSEILTLSDGYDLFYKEEMKTNTRNYVSVIKLKLKKKILILEDIDVECKMVHNRNDILKEEFSKNEKEEDEKDKKKKKLNLSDILQLFDGIVKGYGLIIVMTTNCIEKLDEALIREGRITKRINLTMMLSSEANKMIKYYFPNAKDIKIKSGILTPAKLENLCLESPDYNKLEEKLISFIE